MSIAPFSPLEIQLVRASLSTKTTQEICELLERSVEEVTALINDITDGKAEDRESDVKLYIQEKEKEKANKKRRRSDEASEADKKKKQERESIALERKKKALTSEKAWQVGRAEYRKREDQRKYKTRVVDQSKLITVRLDEKTWAQVEIQETKEKTNELIEKTRATYEANKILNQYKIAQN